MRTFTEERPFRDFAEEMWRAFDESSRRGTWPPVDIKVDGDDVVLSAEMPGVRREDLQIEVDGQHLTLKGEKPEPGRGDGVTAVHRERRFGPFERTFELGFEVDREKIEAEYKQGVLTIRLPKAEAAKPRRIEVRSE